MHLYVRSGSRVAWTAAASYNRVAPDHGRLSMDPDLGHISPSQVSIPPRSGPYPLDWLARQICPFCARWSTHDC